MYLSDVCTIPVSLAGLPGDLACPAGSPRGCRSACRSPAAEFGESRCSPPRTRYERAIGFETRPPRGWLSDRQPGSR